MKRSKETKEKMARALVAMLILVMVGIIGYSRMLMSEIDAINWGSAGNTNITSDTNLENDFEEHYSVAGE